MTPVPRYRQSGASTPSPKARGSRIPLHPKILEARAGCPDRLYPRGDLTFDPLCGSRTTAVVAKELNSFFVGAELEKEFAELAVRRTKAVVRERVPREISEQRWSVIPPE